MNGYNVENGNVLFIILIAVALFGALSYAVTSSSRGGGKNANQEEMEMEIAKLDQYFALVRNTMIRLQLSNGCGIEQISLETETWPRAAQRTAAASNSNSPEDSSCHLFHKNGGNLHLETVNQDKPYYTNVSYIVIDDKRVPNYGVGGSADLIVAVTHITENFCAAVNKYYKGTEDIPQVAGLPSYDAIFDGNFFDHPNNIVSASPGCDETTNGTSHAKFFIHYPVYAR